MTDSIHSEPVSEFLESTIRRLHHNPVKGSEVFGYAALQSIICAQETWEELTSNSFTYSHNLAAFTRWVDEACEESLNGSKSGFTLVKDHLAELNTALGFTTSETFVA